MSTRAMVDFVSSFDLAESRKRNPDLKVPKDDDKFYTEGKRLYQVSARIYRHSDGYPEGLGADLLRFLRDVEKQTEDTRFNDPEYLAAKFVVWQALEYTKDQIDYSPGPAFGTKTDKNPLDFLGIGVSQEYHSDLEYVYRVDCSKLDENERPIVTYAEFTGKLKFKSLPKEALTKVQEAKH